MGKRAMSLTSSGLWPKIHSSGEGSSVDERIPILHLEYDAVGAAPTCVFGAAEVLVVLWVNDVPVGQAYFLAEQVGLLSPEKLAKAAVDQRAVEAARALSTSPVQYGHAVSVVICTRDRPEELARCLMSFRNQTRSPNQVIVVDNASREGERVRTVVEAAGADYIREDRPGLDFARNAGALAASGNIIAYTDDDVALHPRWLERLVAAFDTEDIMAVTGLVLPGELETKAQQIFERHWGFGRGFQRIDFGQDFFEQHRRHGCPAWEIGAGANMAFRRQVFDLVGLFDERLDVGAAGCSGDSEFWHRILAAGWQCRYAPAAVVFHFHRRSMDGLARQIHAYMSGHVAALLVQYERSREWGNLRRAFLGLPRWYARRYVGRMLHGGNTSNLLLGEEIRGAVSGLIYYVKAKRPVPQPPLET